MCAQKTVAGVDSGGDVKRLQAVLKHETHTRQQQEVFNSKLQEEYDLLLKKLAAAELHIDQLRLRANVNVNKRFILTHDSIQTSVLQQGLNAGRYSPVPPPGESPRPIGGGVGADEDSRGRDGGVTPPASSHAGGGAVRMAHSLTERTLVPIEDYNSLPPKSHVPPKDQHGPSKQHFTTEEEQAYLPWNMSQSFIHDFDAPDDPLGNVAPSFLLSQTLSDVQSENLSQMSVGYIRTQASAESQHLSQIFQIRSLQEQIASLKEKLVSDDCSFDELSEDLSHILEEHEALTGNFAKSGEQLEHLQEKYKDKASRVIGQRKAVMENELVALAERLKELDTLLRERTTHLSGNRPRGLKQSSPQQASFLLSSGSEGHLSEDSLNSPSLPSRYLSKGANLNSTNTSAELAQESRSPLSDDAAMESHSLVSNMIEDLELDTPHTNRGVGGVTKSSGWNGHSPNMMQSPNQVPEIEGVVSKEPLVPPGSGGKKTLFQSRIPQRIHPSFSTPPRLIPLRKTRPASARAGNNGYSPVKQVRKTSCPEILEDVPDEHIGRSRGTSGEGGPNEIWRASGDRHTESPRGHQSRVGAGQAWGEPSGTSLEPRGEERRPSNESRKQQETEHRPDESQVSPPDEHATTRDSLHVPATRSLSVGREAVSASGPISTHSAAHSNGSWSKSRHSASSPEPKLHALEEQVKGMTLAARDGEEETAQPPLGTSTLPQASTLQPGMGVPQHREPPEALQQGNTWSLWASQAPYGATTQHGTTWTPWMTSAQGAVRQGISGIGGLQQGTMGASPAPQLGALQQGALHGVNPQQGHVASGVSLSPWQQGTLLSPGVPPSPQHPGISPLYSSAPWQQTGVRLSTPIQTPTSWQQASDTFPQHSPVHMSLLQPAPPQAGSTLLQHDTPLQIPSQSTHLQQAAMQMPWQQPAGQWLGPGPENHFMSTHPAHSSYPSLAGHVAPSNIPAQPGSTMALFNSAPSRQPLSSSIPRSAPSGIPTSDADSRQPESSSLTSITRSGIPISDADSSQPSLTSASVGPSSNLLPDRLLQGTTLSHSSQPSSFSNQHTSTLSTALSSTITISTAQSSQPTPNGGHEEALTLLPLSSQSTPQSSRPSISRQPASTALRNQHLAAGDPMTPGSSATYLPPHHSTSKGDIAGRGRTAQGGKVKEKPKLTMATVDALRKELVSLREQIVRSSASLIMKPPGAAANTDHTHSSTSSLGSPTFTMAVHPHSTHSVLTALAPSIPNLPESISQSRNSGMESAPKTTPSHKNGMESVPTATPSRSSGVTLSSPFVTPLHTGPGISPSLRPLQNALATPSNTERTLSPSSHEKSSANLPTPSFSLSPTHTFVKSEPTLTADSANPLGCSFTESQLGSYGIDSGSQLGPCGVQGGSQLGSYDGTQGEFQAGSEGEDIHGGGSQLGSDGEVFPEPMLDFEGTQDTSMSSFGRCSSSSMEQRRGSAGHSHASVPISRSSRTEVGSDAPMALSVETVKSGRLSRRGSEPNSWGSWQAYPLQTSLSLSAQVRHDTSSHSSAGRKGSTSARDQASKTLLSSGQMAAPCSDEDAETQVPPPGSVGRRASKGRGLTDATMQATPSEFASSHRSVRRQHHSDTAARTGGPSTDATVPPVHRHQSSDIGGGERNSSMHKVPATQGISSGVGSDNRRSLRNQHLMGAVQQFTDTAVQQESANRTSPRGTDVGVSSIYHQPHVDRGTNGLASSMQQQKPNMVSHEWLSPHRSDAGVPSVHQSDHQDVARHERRYPCSQSLRDVATQRTPSHEGGHYETRSPAKSQYHRDAAIQVESPAAGQRGDQQQLDGLQDGRWQDRQQDPLLDRQLVDGMQENHALDGQRRRQWDPRGTGARYSAKSFPPHSYSYSPLYPYRSTPVPGISLHSSAVEQPPPNKFSGHIPFSSSELPTRGKRHAYRRTYTSGGRNMADKEYDSRPPVASTPTLTPVRRSHHFTPTHTFPSAHVSPIHSHLFSAHPPSDEEEDPYQHVHVHHLSQPRQGTRGYTLYQHAQGSSPEEDKFRSKHRNRPSPPPGRSGNTVGRGLDRSREEDGDRYRHGKDRELLHHHSREKQLRAGRDYGIGWESGVRDRGGEPGRELAMEDGFRYEHNGRDPLLVVNIHKDGEVRGKREDLEGAGGRRKREGRPLKPVLLPKQEFMSSDSEVDADQLQVAGGDGRINLKGAVRLARQLRRRSERMRGALQLELAKQGLL